MSDGLIDPSAFPVPKVDPGQVEQFGRALIKDGKAIAATGHDIDAAWRRLRGFYHSPEADELIAAISPVPAAGNEFQEGTAAAGAALIEFAHVAKASLDRFRSLAAMADAFRAKVAGDDWRADEDLAEENDGLVRAVTHAALEYKAREIECANKITALVGGAPLTGINPATANLDGVETPWGNAGGQDKPWWGDALDAGGDLVGGIAKELGGLTGLFDENGGLTGLEGFGDWWDNFSGAWTGKIEGIAGLAGAHGKDGWGPPDLGTAGDNWKELVHGFVPWREWDERPGYVITTAGINAALAAVTLGAGAGVKGFLGLGRHHDRGQDGDGDGNQPEPVDPGDIDNPPGGGQPPTIGEVVKRMQRDIDELGELGGYDDRFKQLDPAPGGRPDPLPDPRKQVPVGVGGRHHDIHGSHDEPGPGKPPDHGDNTPKSGGDRSDPSSAEPGDPQGPAKTAPDRDENQPPTPDSENPPDEGQTPTGDEPPSERGRDGEDIEASGNDGTDAAGARQDDDRPLVNDDPGEKHEKGFYDPYTGRHVPKGWTYEHGHYIDEYGNKYADVPESYDAVHDYQEIRNSPHDTQDIAHHTGINKDVLDHVKQHLFFQEHDVPLGPNRANRGKFTPMAEIGDLWIKATRGELTAYEKVEFRNLITHEAVERRLMEQGFPYRSAHPGAYNENGMNRPTSEHYGAHDLAPSDKGGDPWVAYRDMDREPPRDFELADDLSNINDLAELIMKGAR
ncbi:hypothetical protein [Actinomadura sp. 9N215]|uniref:hypothetical protein n=1 Tax=Actinomadura sp. 9N215 TaxID=3375150 RepID=UPI0037B78B97